MIENTDTYKQRLLKTLFFHKGEHRAIDIGDLLGQLNLSL